MSALDRIARESRLAHRWTAVDRVRLAVVGTYTVPPYLRVKDGHVEDVSGYVVSGRDKGPASIPPTWNQSAAHRTLYVSTKALATSHGGSPGWTFFADDWHLGLKRGSSRIWTTGPGVPFTFSEYGLDGGQFPSAAAALKVAKRRGGIVPSGMMQEGADVVWQGQPGYYVWTKAGNHFGPYATKEEAERQRRLTLARGVKGGRIVLREKGKAYKKRT